MKTKNDTKQDKESLKSTLNLIIQDENIINQINLLIENETIQTHNELKKEIKKLQKQKKENKERKRLENQDKILDEIKEAHLIVKKNQNKEKEETKRKRKENYKKNKINLSTQRKRKEERAKKNIETYKTKVNEAQIKRKNKDELINYLKTEAVYNGTINRISNLIEKDKIDTKEEVDKKINEFDEKIKREEEKRKQAEKEAEEKRKQELLNYLKERSFGTKADGYKLQKIISNKITPLIKNNKITTKEELVKKIKEERDKELKLFENRLEDYFIYEIELMKNNNCYTPQKLETLINKINKLTEEGNLYKELEIHEKRRKDRERKRRLENTYKKIEQSKTKKIKPTNKTNTKPKNYEEKLRKIYEKNRKIEEKKQLSKIYIELKTIKNKTKIKEIEPTNEIKYQIPEREICPKCGYENAGSITKCWKCGYDLKDLKEKKRKYLFSIENKKETVSNNNKINKNLENSLDKLKEEKQEKENKLINYLKVYTHDKKTRDKIIPLIKNRTINTEQQLKEKIKEEEIKKEKEKEELKKFLTSKYKGNSELYQDIKKLIENGTITKKYEILDKIKEQDSKTTNSYNESTELHYCPECGNKLNSYDKFCDKCGYNLKENKKTENSKNNQTKTNNTNYTNKNNIKSNNNEKSFWTKLKNGAIYCCFGTLIITALLMIIAYLF